MSEQVYTGPHPESWASIDAIRRHYDRLSGYYHLLWGEHIHHGYWEGEASTEAAQVALIQRLAERAQIRPGSRVLDVGCGLGGSSRWLARELACSVLGITISPVQARIAAAVTQRCGLSSRAHFEVFDACNLSQLGERFDAVWVIECSEHLPDKARFIRDCAHVLKPDGRLALCAWLARDPVSWEHHALLQRICRGMLCPSFASREAYVQWMRTSGFGEIESEEIGSRVQKTWTLCAELVQRRWLQTLLQVTDPATREFVDTIPAMQQAFRVGALGYGMFTARAAPSTVQAEDHQPLEAAVQR